MQRLCYRILLVEDDADDRYIMHQAFEELGFAEEVKMFSSGEELNKYLGQLGDSGFPELIVLDYNMPALNGAELALSLKKHPILKAIPVVLYSTGMNPKMKDELLKAGVLHCFEKGMEYNDVLKLVMAFKELIKETKVLSATPFQTT
ncbi:MAG: response regulator [Flaviaesturariibacter sp.]|nr:response regulator [Flaviaesturariibacter sp.]